MSTDTKPAKKLHLVYLRSALWVFGAGAVLYGFFKVFGDQRWLQGAGWALLSMGVGIFGVSLVFWATLRDQFVEELTEGQKEDIRSSMRKLDGTKVAVNVLLLVALILAASAFACDRIEQTMVMLLVAGVILAAVLIWKFQNGRVRSKSRDGNTEVSEEAEAPPSSFHSFFLINALVCIGLGVGLSWLGNGVFGDQPWSERFGITAFLFAFLHGYNELKFRRMKRNLSVAQFAVVEARFSKSAYVWLSVVLFAIAELQGVFSPGMVGTKEMVPAFLWGMLMFGAVNDMIERR